MDSTEHESLEATGALERPQAQGASTQDTSPTTPAATDVDVAAQTQPMAALDADATVAMPEGAEGASVDADATVAIPDPAQAAAPDPEATVADMARIADMARASVNADAVPDIMATPDLDGLETDLDEDTWHVGTDDDVFESGGYVSPSQTASQPQRTFEEIQVKPSSHTAKRVVLTIFLVLLVLAGIYGAVAFYFSSHFLPNTTVNGNEVSGISVAALADQVTQIGESYQVNVSGDGINVTIGSADIDFVYDGDAYAAEAQQQIPYWRWLLELNQRHEYTVNEGTTFSEEKLDAILNAHVGAINKNGTDPVNASMAYDADKKEFAPVSEALGTKVDLQSVINTVRAGVDTMQTAVTLGDAELVQPAITTQDDIITNDVAHANLLLASNITLRVTGIDVSDIDKDMMASWLSLTKDGQFTVNTELIKKWTQGELSEKVDTAGTHRHFTRPDGKVIDVDGGEGDSLYGWIVDGEALATVISDRLAAANVDPIEIPMKQTAIGWVPGGNEWGARYIDVDLEEQYVRMYNGAGEVIWETSCVSGNPIYGGGTDTGVYYIYDKSSPMKLVGLDYNGDGKPDYETDVTYWMPFDGGEGLHDADWRYYFGGSIYTYDGSHGCVNLPYYAAQELYGLVDVGDCVVVHW